MQAKDKHIIQGKWVDCKSAIPIDEMKAIQIRLQLERSDVIIDGDEIHAVKIEESVAKTQSPIVQ